MAYQDNYTGAENQDLAYDLRQRYAKLVGDHIEMVAAYRVEQNFPKWLESIECLYTITEFKFKERTKGKAVTAEDIKNLIKDYNELRKEVVKVANDFRAAWFGKSRDPEAIESIRRALMNLERWLYFKMNDSNIFGSKREVEGLI